MDENEQLCREFDQLIARHRKFIDFLCKRASYGRPFHYQELMEECYVTLLKQLAVRTDGMSELHERAWVYWQCRRAITGYWRQIRRFLCELAGDAIGDESLAVTHEVTGLTLEELGAYLSPAERRLLALLAEGVPDDELASRLRVKEQTVAQMRHNIKKKIKKYMEQ